METLLIYGANGYTGELIARLAASRGQRPLLAGRNSEAVAALAHTLGLAHRVFDLASPAAVDAGLADVATVLHCAGPFSQTSRLMVDGCLRRRVNYLDITGEVDVFEACAARDGEARAAGILLMPGVGFDVVPTDCLAAHLKARLPSATRLALGIDALGRPSRGTALTAVENLHRGGLVRKGGQLVKVSASHRTRTIDFGRGARTAITIPWGDVSTAWHSTHIPDIEVYMAFPTKVRVGARLLGALGPLIGSAPVQRFLKSRIRSQGPGPSDEQRSRERSFLWGEVSDGKTTLVSRLVTPDGYTLTAASALEIADRVARGAKQVGYHTPSSAYGADLILSIAGCERKDD